LENSYLSDENDYKQEKEITDNHENMVDERLQVILKQFLELNLNGEYQVNKLSKIISH